MQLRLINGNITKVEVSRMRGFVDVSTARAGKVHRHKFEIPDYWGTAAEAISQATGHGYDDHVAVVWDHTGADLYSLLGQFIVSCPPAQLSKMAAIESTAQHRQAEKHNKARKAEQMAAIDDLEASVEQFDYITHIKLGGNKETYNDIEERSVSADILVSKVTKSVSTHARQHSNNFNPKIQ